jgi:hypothetical protein
MNGENGRGRGFKSLPAHYHKVTILADFELSSVTVQLSASLLFFAFDCRISCIFFLLEHVRDMVHDHIVQRGVASRERGAALRALVRAGRRGYHLL